MSAKTDLNLGIFPGVMALVLFIGIGSVFADEVSCRHCGMKKSQYGNAWMILKADDGKASEVCSIHCAAIDMVVNKDHLINQITVGDFNTRKQIDAYKAYWVIGGNLPGVMTSRAKWAFEDKGAAKAYMLEHGGQSAVFEEVIRAAFVDLYEDTVAFKRRQKLLKMNKKPLAEPKSE